MQEKIILDVCPVRLVDVEAVDKRKLQETKLRLLHRCLNEVFYKSNEPICIDRSFGRPYKIIDGRHRIYVARQKGYKIVPAAVID